MPHAWLPTPLSWGCDLTERGGGFPGHSHDHDEICLVANQGTLIRHGGRERPVQAGSVFLFRHGENHGYRNRADQQPHLWLVHFIADPGLEAACPILADPDPERRVWRPDAVCQAGFQALFGRLMAESLRPPAASRQAAMSAWLRLILIQVARWSDGGAQPSGLAGDPGIANLWEIINQHAEAPEADFSGALARRVANYDALRHRFKRVYGMAPRELLQQLRIERAKHLLLETAEGSGAIAARLGYARPSEFARAFVRRTGQSPGAFRRNPHGGGQA